MLLTTRELLGELKKDLSKAKQVDVAVAWAKGGDALHQLCQFGLNNPGKLRAVIGLDLYGSEPAALRNLRKAGKLRLYQSSGPVYHPKFFRFEQKGKTTVWVGSSNLSPGAFTSNTELVHQYQDDGSAKKWFEKLWTSLKDATEKEITEYEKARPTIKRTPSPKPKSPPPKYRHPITLLSEGKVKTWSDYLNALKVAEPYWDKISGLAATIFGEDFGWAREIEEVGSLFQRKSWKDLSSVEGGMLLGTAQTFGWLGSMKSARTANHIFKASDSKSRATRDKIFKILKGVAQSSAKNFSKTAARALEDISNIDGFAEGVATRLMAVVRPDRAISVNKKSKKGLAALFELPKSQLVKHYEELLDRVASQSWHKTPKPTDPFELWVWNKRAALLDVFAYDYEEG